MRQRFCVEGWHDPSGPRYSSGNAQNKNVRYDRAHVVAGHEEPRGEGAVKVPENPALDDLKRMVILVVQVAPDLSVVRGVGDDVS